MCLPREGVCWFKGSQQGPSGRTSHQGHGEGPVQYLFPSALRREHRDHCPATGECRRRSGAILAELGDDYEVSYIEKEEKLKDKILRDLMAQAVRAAGPEATNDTPFDEIVRQVRSSADALAELNDPNHVYLLALIETD